MGQYSKVVRGKKKSKPGLVPDAVKIFIARRIIDTTAACVLAAGLFVLLAVASYDNADPSMNTAATPGNGGLHNWMGSAGSYTADFLLQTLGIGALAFTFGFSAWAVRMSWKPWAYEQIFEQ